MNFNINEIPTMLAIQMTNKSVWKPECPISIDRLKLLKVSHHDFNGQISMGQIIVLDKIARIVLNIFEELFILKFPIHSIKTIDEFDGDDELSMAANNSSCFNFRPIDGTKTLSIHSYGLAIDINPVQNPCIVINEESNNAVISPQKGISFLNRNNQRPGMVEPIVEIFKKHGFEWGGDWNSLIDYHHFQIARDKANELI